MAFIDQAASPLTASAGSPSDTAEALLLSPKFFRENFYDHQMSGSDLSSTDASGKSSGQFGRRSSRSSKQLGEGGLSFGHLRETFGLKLLFIIVVGPQLLRGFNSHLSSSAAPYIYRQYEAPSSRVAIYNALIRLPGTCGFLFGLVFETVPLFGYKYAPWMALSTFAGMAGYAAIWALPAAVPSAEGVMALLLLTRVQEAVVSLAVNLQIATKIREHPEEGPILPAFLWSGNQLLAVLAGAAYGPLSDDGRRDPRFSMLLCGCLSVLVLAPICLNFHGERRCSLQASKAESFEKCPSLTPTRLWREEPQIVIVGFLIVSSAVALAVLNLVLESPAHRLGASFGCLAVLCTGMHCSLPPEIARPALFAILHTALTPFILAATFYFCLDSPQQYRDGPHLSPMFYNTVLSLLRAVAIISGLVLYVKGVSRWKYRQIFAVCTVMFGLAEAARAPMYARVNAAFHVPDRVVLGLSFLMEDLASVWFAMANCILILRSCPETMQGIYVSVMVDTVVFGCSVARYFSSAVLELCGTNPRGAPHEDEHFGHLWKVSLGCACLVVLRLPLLRLVPDANLSDDLMNMGDAEDEEDEEEQSPAQPPLRRVKTCAPSLSRTNSWPPRVNGGMLKRVSTAHFLRQSTVAFPDEI